MIKTNALRAQRDKYIAFSLAAADLLIETTLDGEIIEATGATSALLGETGAALGGRNFARLFNASDRFLIDRLLKRVQEEGRIKPFMLHLLCPNSTALVNVGACRLPGGTSIYLSLTLLPLSASLAIPARDPVSGLLNAADFRSMATRAIAPEDDGSGANMLQQMRLVHIEGLSIAMRDLPAARSKLLMAEIGAVLRSCSVSSDLAAQVGENEFGVITDNESPDAEALGRELTETLTGAGMATGPTSPRITTIRLTTGNLDEASVAKALAYVIDNFTRRKKTEPGAFEESVNLAMANTVETFGSIRRLIDKGDFQLHFQPVVDLSHRQVHHHEALLRMSKVASPYEMIRFSEQLGLIADLDIAVCTRAIEELERLPDAKIAVNFSGASVQNAQFRTSLFSLLHTNSSLAERLLFELTESAHIEDIEPAANFVNGLRRRGFSVCLDDFGSGAAAYNYLRRFDADYIKIDGPFMKLAVGAKRDQALIRSICSLARELGCSVIGEMIETEEEANMCQSLGIGFGQGYLFGKPERKIREASKPMIGARKKGYVATWL